MKKLLYGIMASVSISAAAADQGAIFSAFTSGGKLYVTILGDDCNSMGARLVVPKECRQDRETRDLVYQCTVGLSVWSTRMACPGRKHVPRSFEIDLKESGLTRELRELTIHYHGPDVTVKINN